MQPQAFLQNPLPKVSVMPIADQRGASLIEVLVSILILSIGLLGMAGLQTRTLKGNHSALQRSEAVTLTHFIFDAMRANLTAARDGGYATPRTCAVPEVSSALIGEDRRAWISAVRSALGDGSSTCVTLDFDAPSGTYTVTLEWDDGRAGGLSNQTFVTVSRP